MYPWKKIYKDLQLKDYFLRNDFPDKDYIQLYVLFYWRNCPLSFCNLPLILEEEKKRESDSNLNKIKHTILFHLRQKKYLWIYQTRKWLNCRSFSPSLTLVISIRKKNYQRRPRILFKEKKIINPICCKEKFIIF